jgi:signal transduction histidine kinase
MLIVKEIKYEFTITRVLISLISHTVVFIQFNLINFTFDTIFLWSVQFHFVLIVLLTLSIILIFVKNINIIIILILLRFIIQILICFPLGSAIEIKIALLASIIIDTNLILSFPPNIILSSIIIFLTLILQRPITVYGQEIMKPSLYDMMTMLFSLLLFVILSGLLKINNQRLAIKKKHVEIGDEAITNLIRKNISFQKHVTTLSEESIVSERKRISREIHDIIGFTFTNITALLKVAIVLSPKKSLDLIGKLQTAKKLSIDGIIDIRRTLRKLRVVDKKEVSGLNTIHRLIKTFEQAMGTKIRIEYGNVKSLFFEQNKTVVYHLIQEGILNAFRHGKATNIIISFWRDNHETKIIISDNGIGCENLIKGMGFAGMEERLEQIGGSIIAKNTLNGFELSVRIPNE